MAELELTGTALMAPLHELTYRTQSKALKRANLLRQVDLLVDYIRLTLNTQRPVHILLFYLGVIWSIIDTVSTATNCAGGTGSHK